MSAELVSPKLEEKKKLVSEFAKKMKSSKTILIASTKGLPSSQFHSIKKNFRGKADILVAKKSIVVRAIASTEKGALQNLKDHIIADIAIFFSDLDAFELSGLLADNQSPTKARAGEIAPEEISIEPGPTDLIPGPAISELSSVGLKVAVEGGKLAIKQGAVVAKKGEPIKANVASVLGKLNILPMKVGFIPIAAYDSVSDQVYVNIVIDKKIAYEELRSSIGKALGFAVKIGYVCKETLSRLLGKASAEEKAIENLINKSNQNHKEETK
ncbi:MAG: 50S ribosomal protein L10 [Nanoarchaeota archaeon]|nr:50S ribosomal protein L10 [Nanoarchaeota archaeon]